MNQRLQQQNNGLFLEVGKEQRSKAGQAVCGDLFMSRRATEEPRIITILADGLGSGIKASVLSTLTASMAAGCVGGNMDIKRTAEVILSTLPVCSERGLAYSTFTIVDADLARGVVRVIEHENPGFLLIRDNEAVKLTKEPIPLANTELSSRHHELHYTTFELRENDRLVLFSDGISQAGLGSSQSPVGWGDAAITEKVLDSVNKQPDLSANKLAGKIMQRALNKDGYKACDDMTCAVLYYRQTRHLMVVTGPPYDSGDDSVMARKLKNFNGQRLICGGTTASLVAREWGETVEIDYREFDPDVPPASHINGIDLVTEGSLTLEAILKIIEQSRHPAGHKNNIAVKAAELMLHSDRIHFLVGSRINNAHHDPTNPRQLDIRRNIVQKIRQALEQHHLKETDLELI